MRTQERKRSKHRQRGASFPKSVAAPPLDSKIEEKNKVHVSAAEGSAARARGDGQAGASNWTGLSGGGRREGAGEATCLIVTPTH